MVVLGYMVFDIYMRACVCTQVPKEGLSAWCNGYCTGLRNHSKRVRTQVTLLRSLSDKYSWGKV